MPRINIEDTLYIDNRFIDLCVKCGGRSKALGELVSMWIVAQKYYLTHREIPKEVWAVQNLCEDIVTCGLAERTPTGVRARGQDEQFSWLLSKSEAGKIGGKKSVENRRKRTGTAQPPEACASENSNQPRSTLNHTEASSSFSFSTNTNTNTNTNTLSLDSASPLARFEFEKLYSKYPRKEGKERGLKTCRVQIKTQSDYDALSKAIDRYASHVANTATEARFIKHFSTFMTSWRDWIDPKTGSTQIPIPSSNSPPPQFIEAERRRRWMNEERKKMGLPLDE